MSTAPSVLSFNVHGQIWKGVLTEFVCMKKCMDVASGDLVVPFLFFNHCYCCVNDTFIRLKGRRNATNSRQQFNCFGTSGITPGKADACGFLYWEVL